MEEDQLDLKSEAEVLQVLIVDDEEDIQKTVKRRLYELGIPLENIELAEDADAGWSILAKREALKEERKRIHLLLCDIRLKTETDGAEFIKKIKEELPNRPFVAAMSAFKDPKVMQYLIGNADLFLEKDIDFNKKELPKVVEGAIKFMLEQVHEEANSFKEQLKQEASEQSTEPSEPSAETQEHQEEPSESSAETQDPQEASPETPTQKPLNILIIEDTEMFLEPLKRHLEKEYGQSSETIFVARNTDEAFEIITSENNIDLILSDIQLPGEISGGDFLDMVNPKGQESGKEDASSKLNRPYVVGMSGADAHSTETVESIKRNTDKFLTKEGEKFWDELKEAIKAAQEFKEEKQVLLEQQSILQQISPESASPDKIQATMISAFATPSQETGDLGHDDQQGLVIMPKEEPRLVSGKEALSHYEMLETTPNLAAEKNNKNKLMHKIAALFDVDGTLANAFVMGRFVRHLGDSGIFDEWIRQLPKAKQSRNKDAFEELIFLIDFLEERPIKDTPKNRKKIEILKKTPYEQRLSKMNMHYAQMLSGFDVEEVAKVGYEWSLQDFDDNKFDFSIAVIKFVKFLNMTPSLLTGMPAETIQGYREKLEIEEQCHPLLLATKKLEGGKRIYELEPRIVDPGGTATSKSQIANKMIQNHNEILCHMGDQKSDISVMNLAMQKRENALGKGFFVMNQNTIEGQRHTEHLATEHEYLFNRRHMNIIHNKWGAFAVVQIMAQQLHAHFGFREAYLREKGQALTSNRQEIREKLRHFSDNPKDLHQFTI